MRAKILSDTARNGAMVKSAIEANEYLVRQDPDGPEFGRFLRYLRENPNVALTMLADNWYRHISIVGHVVSIDADEGDWLMKKRPE